MLPAFVTFFIIVGVVCAITLSAISFSRSRKKVVGPTGPAVENVATQVVLHFVETGGVPLTATGLLHISRVGDNVSAFLNTYTFDDPVINRSTRVLSTGPAIPVGYRPIGTMSSFMMTFGPTSTDRPASYGAGFVEWMADGSIGLNVDVQNSAATVVWTAVNNLAFSSSASWSLAT